MAGVRFAAGAVVTAAGPAAEPVDPSDGMGKTREDTTAMLPDSDATGPSVPELPRERRAVLVVDVVESVRLMQRYEADVIDRWRRFVSLVRTQRLPACGGRVVKSLGDGMLLDFASASDAASVAAALHRDIAALNLGRPADAAMHLRIGAHMAEVVYDGTDLYGSGVNLAARLAQLAQPGSTVVSAELRDELLLGLDAEAEDLGECHLRHYTGTVRAFRLGPAGELPTMLGQDTLWDSRPGFAVLPIETPEGDRETETLAEVLADSLIQDLSHSDGWRVISRLSTSRLRGRRLDLAALRRHLGATYVLSGRSRRVGNRLRLNLELAHADTASVLWSDSFDGADAEILAFERPLSERIVAAISHAVFAFEMRRSRSQLMATLSSHTLLFSAIALLHRLSRQDFERAFQMLEHLCTRHPHAPEPRAWLAKWHVMRIVQGWSPDPDADRRAGHDSAQRALDERSDHALGLACDGLVAGLLERNLDLAEQRYRAAIASNPQESMAWLFLSALHAYRDNGSEAVSAARRAIRLSPLDPAHYFFESFAAHAELCADAHDAAAALARRSLRANCTHLPTWRTLAIADCMAGRLQDARASVTSLLRLDPHYTVAVFETRNPGAGSDFGRRCADALAEAGLPRH